MNLGEVSHLKRNWNSNNIIFIGPVSETDAPDYKDVVFEAMDLGLIKKNIETGNNYSKDWYSKLYT